MSIRIYHPQKLADKGCVELTAGAAHHLSTVLRCRVGDTLLLFDGSGNEYVAAVVEIKKSRVQVNIEKITSPQRESALFTELGQGISRGERMDFVLQKAVELGVSAITPLFTERCNVKLDAARQEKRLQHWQSVIISACEQSGRVKIPFLNAPCTLSQWLARINSQIKLVLTPEMETTLALREISQPTSVALLIGPEGGLTPTEFAAAKTADFLNLQLGPRVLRTETAALVALTVVQREWGDLGN